MKTKFGFFNLLIFCVLFASCTVTNNPSTSKITDFYYYSNNQNWDIRQPAEFEPSEAVMITSNIGFPVELVTEISKSDKIIIITDDETRKQELTSYFTDNNVELSNCEFWIEQFDEMWTRDFGPWFRFTKDGSYQIVDFTYNREYRVFDNEIPSKYAQIKSLSLVNLDLIHCGGNYMTDGYATAIMTDLIYDENTGGQTLIDQKHKDVLGIKRLYAVEDALGYYIRHIDCWAKLLAPDKILLLQVSPNHQRYHNFIDAKNYFEGLTTSYGTKYKIYTITLPDSDIQYAYTNSLILNNRVFVPLTTQDMETNDYAIEQYQNAMPGYEIVGVLGESWKSTDALHCRVKEIADKNMISIEMLSVYNVGTSIEFKCRIIPYSGGNITEKKLYYKTDANWNQSNLISYGDNVYFYKINKPKTGETVQFYFAAKDSNGKTNQLPYMGELDPLNFTVD